jgi:hypothetical protein
LALPIAHATAGYLVHRAGRGVLPEDRSSLAGWRRAVVFVIVGKLPDMDFLVGFVIGRPGAFHRGISHTLLAAVVFAVAAGAVARWRDQQRFRPTALLFGAAYLSHLLLDYLTIDTQPPLGAQFLWPFSSAYCMSPVTIFTEMHIDGATRAGFVGTVVAWPSVVVLARELVLSSIALGTWFVAEAMQSRLAAGRRPLIEEEDLA